EFSPDGRRLVTASGDGEPRARVWDVATGQLTFPPIRYRARVTWAGFSPAGRRIATAGSDGARVWDAATGVPVTPRMISHHSNYNFWLDGVAFSPDGTRLLTGSHDGTARVWDAASGQPVSPVMKQGDNTRHVAYGPDGRVVATGSDDRTARIWD